MNQRLRLMVSQSTLIQLILSLTTRLETKKRLMFFMIAWSVLSLIVCLIKESSHVLHMV